MMSGIRMYHPKRHQNTNKTKNASAVIVSTQAQHASVMSNIRMYPPKINSDINNTNKKVRFNVLLIMTSKE